MAARAKREGSAATQKRLEKLLLEAMTAADPVAVLRRAARSRAWPAELRTALASVHTDGVRISALLVARLRFERLLQGSETAAWLFSHDPAAFAETFRAYHHSVAPRAFFPQQEAALFADFLASQQRAPRKRRRA